MDDQTISANITAPLLSDIRDSVLRLITAPRSGTETTYERVGEQRALTIGAALNVAFALGMGFGLYRLQQGLMGMLTMGSGGPGMGMMDFVKMFLIGLAPPAGLIGASHLARRLAGGSNLGAGYDALLSGLALLPCCLWFALVGLLGASAYAMLLGLGIFSGSYAVLILCGGFDAKQTEMSEVRATLSVPLVLLASAIAARIACSLLLGI